MSNKQSKKQRQLFNRTMKQSINDAGKEMLEKKVNEQIKNRDIAIYKTSRQRDIFILISIGLLVSWIVSETMTIIYFVGGK